MFLQFLADRKHINGSSAFIKTDESREDPLVSHHIKIFRLENLSDFIIGFRVDQHRPKHCLFRLPAVGLGLNDSRGIFFIRRKVTHEITLSSVPFYKLF